MWYKPVMWLKVNQINRELKKMNAEMKINTGMKINAGMKMNIELGMDLGHQKCQWMQCRWK